MAYSIDIAKVLTDQVAKFVTLNRYQLAGHVANLDFWLAEVRHSLDVINGYGPRFEGMKAAQAKHVAEHATIEFHFVDPCCTQERPGPPRRVPSRDLNEAGRFLRDATYRFLLRCYNEGLIEEATCGGSATSSELGSTQKT